MSQSAVFWGSLRVRYVRVDNVSVVECLRERTGRISLRIYKKQPYYCIKRANQQTGNCVSTWKDRHAVAVAPAQAKRARCSAFVSACACVDKTSTF